MSCPLTHILTSFGPVLMCFPSGKRMHDGGGGGLEDTVVSVAGVCWLLRRGITWKLHLRPAPSIRGASYKQQQPTQHFLLYKYWLMSLDEKMLFQTKIFRHFHFHCLIINPCDQSTKYKAESAKVQKLIFNNSVDGRKDEKKQLIIITSQ